MQVKISPITSCYANNTLDRIGIRQNIYFQSLATGEMSIDAFRCSQEQFYFAVAHFSRPMASLVSRLDNQSQRIKLLRNLLEEHGDFNELACHTNTFKTFLNSIDCKNLEGIKPGAAVMAFNSSLSGICSSDTPIIGLACLGIIEYAFAEISARIADDIIQRGWLNKEQLVHYSVHANLDIEHAQDLFSTVESTWDLPEQKIYTEQGLNLGAYLFNRLYTDLYYSATTTQKENSIFDKLQYGKVSARGPIN